MYLKREKKKNSNVKDSFVIYIRFCTHTQLLKTTQPKNQMSRIICGVELNHISDLDNELNDAFDNGGFDYIVAPLVHSRFDSFW